MPHTASIVEGLRGLLAYGVEHPLSVETLALERPSPAQGGASGSMSNTAVIPNTPSRVGGDDSGRTSGSGSDRSSSSGALKGWYMPPHLRGTGRAAGPSGKGPIASSSHPQVSNGNGAEVENVIGRTVVDRSVWAGLALGQGPINDR